MKSLILATLALVLAGCEKVPQRTSRTSNPDFTVHLLFEHDGIKVYRFHAGDYTVFYTDARGVTQFDTGGKSNQKIRVETVR